MSELEDDIARISASRGRPANYYLERQQQRSRHVITPELIANLFSANPNREDDFDHYDDLSDQARAFLSMAPLQLHATWFWQLVNSIGCDEDQLIAILEAHMRGQLRAWVLKHFGRSHPSVEKLS